MKSKVNSAVLHNMIHTAETGQFGPALNTASLGANRKLSMELADGFLEVTVSTTGVHAGKMVTISVPLTNVSHFIKAVEDKA